MQMEIQKVTIMTDNEFIFYWFLTFFIWNIYYLWIVPKRSAEFWSRRFESKDGQKEYPDVIECIHALLDGGDTLTDLQAQRTAIKNKYPKS